MRERLAIGFCLVALAACGGDAGEPAEAIAQFDSDPAAGSEPRARLNAAVFIEPAATREAALEQVTSEDPDVRIAAVYALSSLVTPSDAGALAPFLESSNSSERVLSAAALLAVGDARAVPVLIESLEEDAAIPFGSPAARVWEKARFALLQATGEDFGLRDANTAAEAAATVPEWEAWWAESESTFEVSLAPDQFGQ